MDSKYDYRAKKIVAVLSSKVDPSIGFNVIGHLAVAIGANAVSAEILGRPFHMDASGISHLGISRYPFIVTKVKPGRLRRAIMEARAIPSLLVADFPAEMLSTGHDDDLNAAIQSKEEGSLEYLGAVFYGPSDLVDSITGRFTLWRSDSATNAAPVEVGATVGGESTQ